MSANRIRWGHCALELEISLGEDDTARLVRLGAPGEAVADPRPGTALPPVELTAAGRGRHWSGRHLWRRPGGGTTTTLHLPGLLGAEVRTERLYPAAGAAVSSWHPDRAELAVTLPTAPSATLLRLTHPRT